MRPDRGFTPLLLPLAAAATGILVASAQCSPSVYRLFAAQTVVGCCLLLLTLVRRSRLLAVGALAVISMGGAAMRTIDCLERLRVPPPPDAPVGVVGTLTKAPLFGEESTTLRLQTQQVKRRRVWLRRSMNLRVSVRRGASRSRLLRLRKGDRVRLFAHLREPVSKRNPGGFNQAASAAAAGTSLLGSVKSPLLVNRLSSGGAHDAAAWLRRRARGKLLAIFGVGNGMLDPDGGLLAAFLLGDRGSLAAADREDLVRGGLFHLLAISGLHVGLLASLVFLLLRSSGLLGYRRRLLLLGGLLILYGAVTEAPPSVTRAVLMAVAAILFRVAGFPVRPLHIFCLVLLATLLLEPTVLFDVGFQLTYMATGGILLLGIGPIDRLLPPLPKLVKRLLGVSIAAFLFATPIIRRTFGRISPASIPGSLLSLPLAMGAVGSGFAGLLLPAPFGDLLLSAAAYLLRLLVKLASLLGSLPGGSYRAAPPTMALALALPAAGILMSLVCKPELFLRRRPRGLLVSSVARSGSSLLVVTLAVLVVWPVQVHSSRKEFRMTVLDVSEGDAIVLQPPRGEAVLVDGGGRPGSRYDVGRRIVLPALAALGIRRLAAVVVTHGHADHIGGLPAVLEELPVGVVFCAGRERALARLLSVARRRGISVVRLRRGMKVDLGGARFTVLWPGRDPMPRNTNDRSLVMDVSSMGFRALLPGDIEAVGEKGVLPLLRRCDLLKIPHHGSRTSSSPALLDKLQCRLALLSVGRFNAFGFPHREVLERLGRSRILRTDLGGALLVSWDGDHLEARSFTIQGGGIRFPRRPRKPS